MFLKDKGINIDETNYNKLFMNQKQFQKQYGVEKSEILAMYDYKKYKKEKSIQELGKETKNVLEDTQYIDETEKKMVNKERKLINKTNENKVE